MIVDSRGNAVSTCLDPYTKLVQMTSLETVARIAMKFNFYWMLPSAYKVPASYACETK